MRIAVLSDTHDHLPSHIAPALAAADEIWHLGDVCDPALLVELEQLGRPLFVVAGNCDAWPAWPLELTLTRAGLICQLVHIPPRRPAPGAHPRPTRRNRPRRRTLAQPRLHHPPQPRRPTQLRLARTRPRPRRELDHSVRLIFETADK